MPEKTIRDIMTKSIVTVPLSDNVYSAIKVMAAHNISCVVIEDNHKPIGMLTERDLVKRILAPKKNPLKVKCKDIMTPHLITVSADSTLAEALDIIQGMHIRRLPVVDRTGIVGLVTISDIVKEAQIIHQSNKRLTFHQTLQSYIIIGITLLFVLIFIFKYYIS